MSKYKNSMFNIWIYNNNDMTMLGYNSYKGLESILIIETNKIDKVMSWVKEKSINDNEDPDFLKLCERGFFVPEETDERANRKFVIYKNVFDSRLRLLIDTTTSCNFRCKYCADAFEKDEIMPIEIQSNIIEFVRKNIGRYTGVSIDWFGGEPLVGLDVIKYISNDLIEICHRARKPYSATITTNGYLLSPNNIEELLRLKILTYTVTVDGLKETHDKLRVLADGSGSYDVIINNLKYIRDKIINPFVCINIRTNITKEIFDKIEEYYLYMDEQFGNDPRFNQLFRVASDWGGTRVASIKDSLVRPSILNDVYEKIARITNGFQCKGNILNLNVGGMSCKSTKMNRYAISIDGDVSKCENTAPFNVIGKIDNKGNMLLDRSQEAIWTCGHRMINEEKCENCDNCAWSMICFMSACPAEYVRNQKKSCGINETAKRLLLLASKSFEIETL